MVNPPTPIDKSRWDFEAPIDKPPRGLKNLMITSVAEPYHVIVKLLHWIIAILIIALIVLGWYMVELSYYDPWYPAALAWHKALGLVALGVVAVKTIWILSSRSLALLPSLRRWERIAAKLTHHILYGMMLLIPLSGYLISTSAGKGVDLWGGFTIPAVLVVGQDVLGWVVEVHYYCSYGTAILIAIHAVAALKHHFIHRDATLRRMLW